MSDAPCPDASTAVTPAAPTESSQLAGIRELVRIAKLQAQAYARAAPRQESHGSGTLATDELAADLPPAGPQSQAVVVPGQRPAPL